MVLNISSVSGKNPALSGRDAQGQNHALPYTCLWAKLCDCTHGKPDKTRTEICTTIKHPAARAAGCSDFAGAGRRRAGRHGQLGRHRQRRPNPENVLMYGMGLKGQRFNALKR